MVVTNWDNECPKGLGIRHLQTFLLFMGMFLAFAMRANMSIAIVDMTNEQKEQHFDWDQAMKALILSSFFWGYIVLQVPAGILSRRLGGKVLFTISVSANSLISLVLPMAAFYGGWISVCCCRILQGLSQAFVYPCMHQLISQWVPVEEKGQLATIIYSGAELGIATQLMVGGFIASAWGWSAIFYVNGILGATWTAFYLVFGAAGPETSKLISEEELAYIQKSLGKVGKQEHHETPWRSIASSLPFWAVIVAHCGQNWGFFTLMTEMPNYMSSILKLDLKNNGMLSSLPYLMMCLLSFPMGALTDLFIRKRWISVSNCRKLFNSIGLWGPAIALIGVCYVPKGNTYLSEALLIITVGINAGVYSGFILSHIDLAPNFSGPLMGITNLLANIISIIASLVCGAIVQDENNPAEWRKVFFVASGIYFFTNLFYICFGTAARQNWNEPSKKTRNNDLELK